VCSFITSNNPTEHTHKTKQVHKINSYSTCQLNMSSMCPPVVALHSHFRRRCHSPTLLSMNDCGSLVSAMPRQLFISLRQLSRNFDDGINRPSAEGHPRWHNQPGSNPNYSASILCRRSSTLGPWGPGPPVCGCPRFLKVFPILSST